MDETLDDIATRVPSLDEIEDEIRDGLPMARCRLDEAAINDDFLSGDNHKYLPRREAENARDYRRRAKAYSYLTRAGIDALTSLLYTPGPSRHVEGGGEASTFLDGVWRQNHVNHLMHQADRKATLNDACAIQVAATGRPDKPIVLYLWGASEFEVFCRDDDPTDPWAVVTMSVITQGKKKWRRYQAWTANEHRVYETKPVAWTAALPTAGGVVADYRPDLSGMPSPTTGRGDGRNPYGVLPFSFVWHERPITGFWQSGLGSMLRRANEVVDRKMSNAAQHMEEYLDPYAFVVNVPTNTRFVKKPGMFNHLKATAAAKEGDSPLEPSAFYLQANLAIQDAWWDVQKFANQVFHDLKIPLSAVRDDQQGPQSGVQLVQERVPLLDYTRQRQPEFACYEEELARVILSVAGAYYDRADLAAAAEALELTIAWNRPQTSAVSTDQDMHEGHDLQIGVATRISLLMDRGLTREQAIARLEQLAEDAAQEAKIFPEPDPVAAQLGPDGQPVGPAGEAGQTKTARPIAVPAEETDTTSEDEDES